MGHIYSKNWTKVENLKTPSKNIVRCFQKIYKKTSPPIIGVLIMAAPKISMPNSFDKDIKMRNL
jgi:hypothetical protein